MNFSELMKSIIPSCPRVSVKSLRGGRKLQSRRTFIELSIYVSLSQECFRHAISRENRRPIKGKIRLSDHDNAQLQIIFSNFKIASRVHIQFVILQLRSQKLTVSVFNFKVFFRNEKRNQIFHRMHTKSFFNQKHVFSKKIRLLWKNKKKNRRRNFEKF